jgi:hypothetical protein
LLCEFEFEAAFRSGGDFSAKVPCKKCLALNMRLKYKPSYPSVWAGNRGMETEVQKVFAQAADAYSRLAGSFYLTTGRSFADFFSWVPHL